MALCCKLPHFSWILLYLVTYNYYLYVILYSVLSTYKVHLNFNAKVVKCSFSSSVQLASFHKPIGSLKPVQDSLHTKDLVAQF